MTAMCYKGNGLEVICFVEYNKHGHVTTLPRQHEALRTPKDRLNHSFDLLVICH